MQKKRSGQSQRVQSRAAARLSAAVGPAPAQPGRLWVLDEHRDGLLPVIRRVWGRRGVRVHALYATRYQWGYLHEALEVDGNYASELLFTPAVVIQDQAGFHLLPGDPPPAGQPPAAALAAYCPELNPVERFGGLRKARVSNRLYPSLRKLEDHLAAVARHWCQPAQVKTLIHGWLADQANSGAPA